MGTRIVGGPRDGHRFERRETRPLLWCAQMHDTDAVMKHQRGEDDPDGTTVYHFVQAKRPNGHVLTEAEWREIPEPRWIPVDFS